MDRSYTVLVYPLAHPSKVYGAYQAECVQYPALSGNGNTPLEAVDALKRELIQAAQVGEPEVEGEAVITSLTLSAGDAQGEAHTYTAIVTPDAGNVCASYCPALGVASDGESVDEALAMLREAAELYLEDIPAPANDVRVAIEQIRITTLESLAV